MGTAAAKRGDVASMGDAIQAHAAIIHEQKRLVRELRRDAEAYCWRSTIPSGSDVSPSKVSTRALGSDRCRQSS